MTRRFCSIMWLLIHLSNAFKLPVVARQHRLTRLVRFSSTREAAKPNASSTLQTDKLEGPNRWKEQTGGLRRLPVISPPVELRNRARRAVFLTKADDSVKNIKQRAKKHGAESINALAQVLCIPLRDTVKAYRFTLRNLHPFEQVVAELTVSNRQQKDGLSLDTVLEEIHEARKMVLDASKDWIAKIKAADTAREAGAATKEGTDAILQLFQDFADPPLSGLVQLQKALRNAPIVQLDTPTMVLVGYPNVGKSSIVRKLTTAAPEINNYPFTTRGLTVGHYDISWNDSIAVPFSEKAHPVRYRCQIMDSPGVLNRSERNKMEQLTVAAMQHLPTAVCFVVDLTNTDTVKDQLEVRRQMRARFPKRPWMDVAAKADLDWDEQGEADWRKLCNNKCIAVSIEEGQGVAKLNAAVANNLGKVQLVLTAMNALKDD